MESVTYGDLMRACLIAACFVAKQAMILLLNWSYQEALSLFGVLKSMMKNAAATPMARLLKEVTARNTTSDSSAAEMKQRIMFYEQPTGPKSSVSPF